MLWFQRDLDGFAAISDHLFNRESQGEFFSSRSKDSDEREVNATLLSKLSAREVSVDLINAAIKARANDFSWNEVSFFALGCCNLHVNLCWL